MEEAKYSITSIENYEWFIATGENEVLNDIDINELKSGDRIVIACEGKDIEIEVK